MRLNYTLRLWPTTLILSVRGSSPNHRYGKAECCELLAFHGEEIVRHVVSDRIPVADKPFTKVCCLEIQGVSMKRVCSAPGCVGCIDWGTSRDPCGRTFFASFDSLKTCFNTVFA